MQILHASQEGKAEDGVKDDINGASFLENDYF